MSKQASKTKEPVLNSTSIKARKPRKSKALNLDGVDFYGSYAEGCVEVVTAAEEREVLSSLRFGPSVNSPKFDY